MYYLSVLSSIWEPADVGIVFVQNFGLLFVCGDCVVVLVEYCLVRRDIVGVAIV